MVIFYIISVTRMLLEHIAEYNKFQYAALKANTPLCL
jgi:hypothetical protein